MLNEYAATISPRLYSAIPKAVFAAIAVSRCTGGGDWIEQANERLCAEWVALHIAGIVSQRPTAEAKRLAARADELAAID